MLAQASLSYSTSSLAWLLGIVTDSSLLHGLGPTTTKNLQVTLSFHANSAYHLGPPRTPRHCKTRQPPPLRRL